MTNPFAHDAHPHRHPMNGTRTFVAASMVVLMAAVLLVALLRPAPEKAFSQDIQLVLITALVTKFGTVVDWLFGSSNNNREGPAGTVGDPVQTEITNPPSQPVPVEQAPETTAPGLPLVRDPFTEPVTTATPTPKPADE